jgi:hypothetical protein
MNASATFTNFRTASSIPAVRRPERRLRGLGLILGAVVSLGMWAGLVYLVIVLVG